MEGFSQVNSLLSWFSNKSNLGCDNECAKRSALTFFFLLTLVTPVVLRAHRLATVGVNRFGRPGNRIPLPAVGIHTYCLLCGIWASGHVPCPRVLFVSGAGDHLHCSWLRPCDERCDDRSRCTSEGVSFGVGLEKQIVRCDWAGESPSV